MSSFWISSSNKLNKQKPRETISTIQNETDKKSVKSVDKAGFYFDAIG